MAIEGADGGQDLDLITASLRADTTDVSTFVEALAVKLEDAIPGLGAGAALARTHVRAQGRSGGSRSTRADSDSSCAVRATTSRRLCSRLSGGIVLKTETVDIDAWLTALAEALAAQAQRSQTTRQALERLLNG